MKLNSPHELRKVAGLTPGDASRAEGEPAPTSANLERRLAAWREAFPKLDDMVAHELWTNLRMRWTCHSNAIEGNTLTYRGTTLLLLFGRAPRNRSCYSVSSANVRSHSVATISLMAMDPKLESSANSSTPVTRA